MMLNFNIEIDATMKRHISAPSKMCAHSKTSLNANLIKLFVLTLCISHSNLVSASLIPVPLYAHIYSHFYTALHRFGAFRLFLHCCYIMMQHICCYFSGVRLISFGFVHSFYVFIFAFLFIKFIMHPNTNLG